MPLPLIAIGALTAASIAIPFFLRTPQEQATIELNEALKKGNFKIVKEPKPLKKEISFPKDPKIILIIGIIIIAFIVLVAR